MVERIVWLERQPLRGSMTKKEKPECRAWLQLPRGGKRAIVKCTLGKHRGRNHNFFWEFHIEDAEGIEPWQVANITWKS